MLLDLMETLSDSPITKRGDVYRTACPIHRGMNTTAFVIFDDTDRFFCHGCGESGDAVDLLVKTQDISEAEAMAQLKLNKRPERVHIVHERDRSQIDFTSENNYFLAAAAPSEKAKELFNDLIKPHGIINRDLLAGIVGYDTYNNTLTVALHNDGRVVQIKRRKVKDIKWMGMKGSDGIFAPFRNTGKKYVFIASGMAEFLILQASGLDYITLQSDSVAIPYDISDKIAVVFEDNDIANAAGIPENLRDGANPNVYNRFREKVTTKIKAKVIPIDFQNVLNRDLPKGYDLRDFVNENKDWYSMIKAEVGLWADNYNTLTKGQPWTS
jgi:hypothetical protein